jgi:putative transposase
VARSHRFGSEESLCDKLLNRKDETVADYDVSVSESIIPDLLDRPNALSQLVETVIQQVLEAQVSEHLGADRYERAEDRAGYRNGYRDRQLYTRVGPLTLRVPQTREGSFSSEIFSRYRRSEQAFVLGIMEMVVNGVSTRKVSEITEALCGMSFSKSTVSRLAMNLDTRVNAFLSRRLDEAYPFVVVDALFTKSRCEDRVMSKAVLVVGGIRSDGYRDILGVSVGDAESAATWNELFTTLKRRGLHGVDFVVSDDHAGLVEAVNKQFAGTTWQRCQIHLLRNMLGHCPSRERADLATAAGLIFRATDIFDARRHRDEFIKRFAKTAPKAVLCLENGFDDAMAVMSLPEKYRRRLRSTNMMERLNEEIRRRERVIRVFPNDASVLRIIGALLAEISERWQEKIYFDMCDYHEWVVERTAPKKGGTKAP